MILSLFEARGSAMGCLKADYFNGVYKWTWKKKNPIIKNLKSG
jgi:hypothetical protein